MKCKHSILCYQSTPVAGHVGECYSSIRISIWHVFYSHCKLYDFIQKYVYTFLNSTAKMCALSVLNVNCNLKCELLTIPRNLAAFLRTLFPLLLMAVQSTDWFWSALSSSQQFLLFCKPNRRHISNACG